MASERKRSAQVTITLEQQNAIRDAARSALGLNVSLKRLSSGLLEASLRTLEEAGMAKEIPTILRAAAGNYERACQAAGTAH
ncbi:hypothetical protein [Novosphingopyxis sp.]|uniref:hypothetical protein n=1 Tax=Novosphingopyxis sp. TaxID=2709690 RepID=UPI003B5C4645